MKNADSIRSKRHRFDHLPNSSQFSRKKHRPLVINTASIHIQPLGLPLVSTSQTSSSESINLEPYRPYTIGRAHRHCDFVFEDRQVSKKHFQILFDALNRKICISDGVFWSGCGGFSRVRVSMNGVFVNGVRIVGGQVAELGAGDEVSLVCGKSNVAGYRDGPSEGAMFSTDFDVIYVRPTCSLLVVDRGNAALRQISLNQEDCDYQYNSISSTEVIMVIGAVLIGYASCILQQGFGSSLLSKVVRKHPLQSESQAQQTKDKPTIVETIKEEQEAGWPSFGMLIINLSKLATESLSNTFLSFIPFRFHRKGSTNGLTPLKVSLIMPEDEAEPPVVQKQRTPTPLSETQRAHTPNAGDKYSEMKPPKMRSASFKDPSLSSKHRSSKRQEYDGFYGSGEVPPYGQYRSKSQKDRTKHRQRDKSGEVVSEAVGMEQRPVEMKPANYDDPKTDHYSMRSKYGNSFRF